MSRGVGLREPCQWHHIGLVWTDPGLSSYHTHTSSAPVQCCRASTGSKLHTPLGARPERPKETVCVKNLRGENRCHSSDPNGALAAAERKCACITGLSYY